MNQVCPLLFACCEDICTNKNVFVFHVTLPGSSQQGDQEDPQELKSARDLAMDSAIKKVFILFVLLCVISI